MVYRKISDTTRALVLLLGMKKKHPYREISEKAGISKSAVARLLKSGGDARNKERKSRQGGRPKKLLERDRRQLARSIVQLRVVNPNFSLKTLISYSGLNRYDVSYRTFYREVRSQGFQYLQARKKGVLSRLDRIKRLKFARKCKQILKGNPQFFHQNIAFYLDGVSFVFKTNPMGQAVVPKGKVWRKKKEGLQITSKGSKTLPGGKSLHLLVAISYSKGVILAEEYKKINGNYFSDFIERNFPILFSGRTGEKMFIMDNDPSQTSAAAMKAIQNQGSKLFVIPPRSPDLNPIENFFHIVKKELEFQARETGIIRESWCEFKARVRKTILESSVDFINNLLLSMPRRIDAVITGKGFRTKY